MSDLLETKVTTYLISNDLKPCLGCGKPTYQIDIYSEARFCSDECTNKFYREVVNEAEMIYLTHNE